MQEKTTLYFESPGEENTKACIERVRHEVEENGYRYVVVASTSGETGVQFAEALEGLEAELFVVKYSDDKEQSVDLPEATKAKLSEHRATFFGSPSIKLSLDASFGLKLAPMGPSAVVEKTLLRFGEGLKVCCEIVMMCADKGLISQGLEVIAVAGTQSGADTVAVIKAASTMRFQELKVLEVHAKPRS